MDAYVRRHFAAMRIHEPDIEAYVVSTLQMADDELSPLAETLEVRRGSEEVRCSSTCVRAICVRCVCARFVCDVCVCDLSELCPGVCGQAMSTRCLSLRAADRGLLLAASSRFWRKFCRRMA